MSISPRPAPPQRQAGIQKPYKKYNNTFLLIKFRPNMVCVIVGEMSLAPFCLLIFYLLIQSWRSVTKINHQALHKLAQLRRCASRVKLQVKQVLAQLTTPPTNSLTKLELCHHHHHRHSFHDYQHRHPHFIKFDQVVASAATGFRRAIENNVLHCSDATFTFYVRTL